MVSPPGPRYVTSNHHMYPPRSRPIRPYTSASPSIEDGRLEARSALASLERICASVSYISYKSTESQGGGDSDTDDKSFSFEDPMKSAVSHSDSGIKLLSSVPVANRNNLRNQKANTTTNSSRTTRKTQAMKDSMLPIYNRLVRWSSSFSLRRDATLAPINTNEYSPLNTPDTTASSTASGIPTPPKLTRSSRLFTKRVTVPIASSGISNLNMRTSFIPGRSSQSQMFLAAPTPRIETSKDKGLVDKSKRAARSLSRIWS